MVKRREEENKENPIDIAMRQVDIAAEKLNLDPGLGEKIKQTKRELIVHSRSRWMMGASRFLQDIEFNIM